MKKLFFNQNNYLQKNNFSNELKKELKNMFHGYFRENITVPNKFEVFDKEISNLVIKILDEQDLRKKAEKRKIKTFRCTKVHKTWTSGKFIK